MSRRLVLVLWLVLAWVLLWEGLTVANVAAGTAAGVALVLAFPPRVPAGRWHIRPVATVRLTAHFVVKLLQANAVVAWEVLTPSNYRVDEGIVRVPLDSRSPGIVTLVANAVSLTPGTLTIEVENQGPSGPSERENQGPSGPSERENQGPSASSVLYVHVLHLTSPEQVRDEVRRFERLAVAAFPQDPPSMRPSSEETP